jgi:hypothetical protein
VEAQLSRAEGATEAEIVCLEPAVCEADLRDSTRFLLGASDQKLREFALRQLHARRRTTQLLRFYRGFPCRMSSLHLLTSCAVTLGRLCGYSTEFDEMGECFMPVSAEGTPRTPEWSTYIQACANRRPMAVRDELWLAAHMKDMKTIQDTGMDRQFHERAAEHSRDPMWRMAQRHMEVTLGSRLMDDAALSGEVAYETAIAHSLLMGLKRLFSRGWDLLRYFARETARAILVPSRNAQRDLVSYRRMALELIKNTFLSWAAYGTYQRGVKARDRGSERTDAHWPLLEEALGPRIDEVHPFIVDFYGNPSRFQAEVSVHLETLPARLVSFAATLMLGQGLYETHLEKIDARFRAFRRADGSLHFVRELYCEDRLRIFDSDFVIRELDGVPRLFEVFSDLRLSVAMRMEPAEGRGLIIQGGEIFYRKIRLPSMGLQVRFQSSVVESGGKPELRIHGRLLMQPRSAMGRFLVRTLLRRPEQLGGINYVVRALAAETAAGA